MVVVLVVQLADRARGTEVPRCERFAAASAERAALVTGAGDGPGDRVVVLGDSWSAGLGLADLADSWPTRLPGRVRVAGFSGSGFSIGASRCAGVSFAERAGAALRGGADLVVVEGGLNDVDQPPAAVETGFGRLMARLAGHRVVVVGPASAPARMPGVADVDRLLARLAAGAGAAYVPTAGLDLEYLPDRLHLTPAGHRAFGDAVAAAIDRLDRPEG